MIMFRYWAIASLIVSGSVAPSSAQDPIFEVTKVAAELGVSVLKENSQTADFTIPSSALPPGVQARELEASLQKYTKLRNAHTSAQTGLNTLGATVDGIIGLSAATGSIAGVVGGAALRATVELGNNALNQYAEERSRTYLVGVGKQLVEASGADDFEALVNDRALLERTIVGSTTLLKDVRERAQETGDAALVSTVAASIAQVADAKAVAAYRAAAGAVNDIESLDLEFSAFVNKVSDEFREANFRLEDHAKRLVNLERDVQDLGTAVDNMKVQVNQLGRNQDLIADFVFTRMTPAERVSALQNGLVDNRIRCPNDAPSCDRQEIRKAMIERYSREASVQQTIKRIGGIVKDANTAFKIANDLGIDMPPEVGKAVGIATAGFNAFTNFTSGNFLGAISSITGLFGGKKDAAAERHKQMMQFLKQNFEQVNKKLDDLRDGQTRIIKSVVQVSEQIHSLHVDMDARFRALDFRLDLIDRQLRQLIWQPWASCATVSNFARYPSNRLEDFYVDRETLFFRDLGARVLTLNADESAVRSCMRVLNDSLGAVTDLNGWTRFGAFVDLERGLIDLSAEQIQRLEKAIADEGATDYRPLLPKYIDSTVNSSTAIVQAWASREGIDGGTLLYLLAANARDLQELNLNLETVFPADGGSVWRFSCSSSDPRFPLIGGGVCRTDNPVALIDAHLNAALDTTTLTEISDWTVVVSQILDLHDGSSDKFARTFTEVENIGAGGAGKRLIQNLLPLMTIGVAYENRLHGGLTAWIIAEDIKAGRAGSAHSRILTANPYLAENVAMLLVRELAPARTDRISLTNLHAQAILHAREEQPFRFGPLKALYGDNQKFQINEYGHPAILFKVGNGHIALPLPGPARLEHGSFIQPFEFRSLSEARERVLERFIDYELGSDSELVQALLAVRR